MPKEYDISTIELFLSGGMKAAEKTSFQQRIMSDDLLKKEVDVFDTIFSGFAALKEETLLAQMEGWNQEWETIDQEESSLIEAYHTGNLGPEGIKRVEDRMKKDQNFAQKVADYTNIFSGFEALKENTFAEQMQKWEGERGKIRTLRPIFIRIAAAASFLILLGIGLNWYADQNYNSTQLISNYYKAPSNSTLMGEKAQDATLISTLFEQAHQLLQQKDYQQAFNAFTQLEEQLSTIALDDFTKTYYQDNVEWNKALAALGGAQTETETLQLLESIRNNPQQEYQEEAGQLSQQLNSFWRKLGRN